MRKRILLLAGMAFVLLSGCVSNAEPATTSYTGITKQYICEDGGVICYLGIAGYAGSAPISCIRMTSEQLDEHCPVVDLELRGTRNGTTIRLALHQNDIGNLTREDLKKYVLSLCPNATEIPTNKLTEVDFRCK